MPSSVARPSGSPALTVAIPSIAVLETSIDAPFHVKAGIGPVFTNKAAPTVAQMALIRAEAESEETMTGT